MRPGGPVSDRGVARARTRGLALLVALAGVAVCIAGCGGGSGLTVASISSSATPNRHLPSRNAGGAGVRVVGGAASPAQRAQTEVAGLLFSRCMRAHGVPDFPDPPPASSSGFAFFGGGNPGFDPAAPLFRKAQRACFSILARRRTVTGIAIG